MSNSFQREQLCDGVHFSSVTDPKFKHNRITANLVIPLDRETVTDNAVVPFPVRRDLFSRLSVHRERMVPGAHHLDQEDSVPLPDGRGKPVPFGRQAG